MYGATIDVSSGVIKVGVFNVPTSAVRRLWGLCHSGGVELHAKNLETTWVAGIREAAGLAPLLGWVWRYIDMVDRSFLYALVGARIAGMEWKDGSLQYKAMANGHGGHPTLDLCVKTDRGWYDNACLSMSGVYGGVTVYVFVEAASDTTAADLLKAVEAAYNDIRRGAETLGFRSWRLYALMLSSV